MPKPFVLSETTAQLVNYLRNIEKGMQVTYAELSQLTGSKITPQKTTYARFMLQRDSNAVWVSVRPGVGLRRLTDAEIADRLPVWWLNGARTKLKRGGKQANVVDARQLDITQQTRFGVDCIQRELAFNSLSKAARSKLEKVARGTSNDLPAFNMLEWAISLTARPDK